MRALTNRYLASALGIGAALLLAVTEGSGDGGLALWPLFGTTNQLVAGVTLLVVSVWLKRHGKPIAYTMVPMGLVASVTIWAMVGNLAHYYGAERWLLLVSGSLVLVFDIWILFEGLKLVFGDTPGRATRAPA